jgi:hypothetical protein
MIKLFRNIRQNLLKEGKTSKYFKYAIGEIVLVVIGILIALQINNQNDARKELTKEMHYLQNIKSDLQTNIVEMDKYMATRTECIAAANRIIEHFEGKALTDISKFNEDQINIYSWRKFYQSNNTFQELTNSGNLAIIKNDSIKNMLLDIESLYKVMKAEEEHFRYDTEILLYEPLYNLMDLNPMVKNYTYRASNGQAGENIELSKTEFDSFLKDKKIKNGFVMTVLEFTVLNDMFRDMKQVSEKLIKIIEKEIEKNK